jgi:hypothetical protein
MSVSDVNKKYVATPASMGSAIAEAKPKAPANLLLPRTSKTAEALLVLMMIRGNRNSTFSPNLILRRLAVLAGNKVTLDLPRRTPLF